MQQRGFLLDQRLVGRFHQEPRQLLKHILDFTALERTLCPVQLSCGLYELLFFLLELLERLVDPLFVYVIV